MPRALLRPVLMTATLGWAAAMPLAAFSASRPASGSIAYLSSVAVYAVGALVCHQRAERSFHSWGAQWPVCARCAGIYVGAALGIVGAASLIYSARARTPAHARRLLLVAALPTVATLLVEWTMSPTGNWVRAAAGVPLGLAVGWILGAVSAPRINPARIAVELH